MTNTITPPRSSKLVCLVSLVALAACEPPAPPKKKFYMVTHGASTNQGFWGNVLKGANEEAMASGVTLIPLHPATEVTGEQLDILMDQAIAAKPDGILATIWGDGMPQRVKAANDGHIPLAAINVYPDPATYSPTGAGGKPRFEFYSGQQDYDAATTTTDAIICAASGAGELANGQCGTTTVAAAYAQLKAAGALAFGVFKNESSGGVNARQQAMTDRIRALDATATVDVIEWDRSIPGDDSTKIAAFFSLPRVSGATRILTIAAAADAAASVSTYLSSNTTVAAKVVSAVFDKPNTACVGFTAGWLKFWVDQNESDQGRKALRYLEAFIAKGELPAVGKDTTGTDEPAWVTSADGFPWFRTGPRFHPNCD